MTKRVVRNLALAVVLLIVAGLMCMISACRHTERVRNTILVSCRHGGGQVPVWIDDRNLYYMAANPYIDDAQKGIYRIGVDGDRRQMIARGSLLGPEAWDHMRGILYISDGFQVYVLDPGKGSPREVSGNLRVTSLSVSTDGRMAGIVQEAKGVYNLAVLATSSGGWMVTKLTHYRDPSSTVYAGVAPAWSLDGRSILFARSQGLGGDKCVQIVRLDTRTRQVGKSMIPIDADDCALASPVRYAYSVGERIYVVDSGRKPLLVATDRSGTGPHSMAWSPDGKRLAYSSDGYDLRLLTFP